MKIKVLFLVLVLAAVASVGISFWRFYLGEDYLVFANVPCDPDAESCFIGGEDDEHEFYKHVAEPAYEIPECNAWSGECLTLSCEESEPLCEEVTCDPETEECAVPAGG